jgi:hypothetical protein
VRTDSAGNPYLDRNWTINVEIQPSTPVLVRLFVGANEFQRLLNAPGGPSQPSDINLTKVNGTACGNYPGGGAWIWNDDIQFLNDTDLAYTFSIDGFSSFYLHGGDQLTSIEQPLLYEAGLYPIPAFDKVYLRGLPKGPFNIRITDLSGREVAGMDVFYDGSAIQLPALPVGTYVLRAANGRAQWTSKLVVAP